eukprot:m.486875 g.486875  ORF g.486875 m.486875 type:complete len:137 (+) comp24647_c0_seq1:261-671(+)
MDAAAHEYLEEHRLVELMQSLTAQLVFHRPENPRAFLIEHVEKLKSARDAGGAGEAGAVPTLFDAGNATALFKTMDPTGKGYISREQYRTAMKTLYVNEFNDEPDGYVENRITLETFQRESADAVAKAESNFAEPL